MPELYEEHLKTRRDDLERHGWIDADITYEINEYRFRETKDMHDRNSESIMCLGCSITFGEGLPLEQTWPYLLGKKLGLPSYNLGMPGGAIEGFYRVCEAWLPIIQSKHVFLLKHPGNRREFYAPGVFKFINLLGHEWQQATEVNNNKELGIKDEYERLLMNDIEFDITYRRNINAIKWLCHQYGAKFYEVPWARIPRDLAEKHKARDLGHPGLAFMEEVCRIFVRQMQA